MRCGMQGSSFTLTESSAAEGVSAAIAIGRQSTSQLLIISDNQMPVH